MRTYGFTLIEILISLFILSFIMLSFNGILLHTKLHTYDEYYYSIASQQMITIIERLHALSDSEGINDQLNTWNSQNMQVLPKSEGIIDGSYPFYTVTLHWGNKYYIRENITV